MWILSNILNWVQEIFKPTSKPMKTKIKILLISKSKNVYGCTTPASLSTGLFNSAKHVASALNKTQWANAKVVSVVDNNDIDREVAQFKPNVVIIEALWVVPEKFDILKKLHPTVEWVVRIHSETPFLAGEGAALSWIDGYLKRDVKVAPNISSMVKDLGICFPDHLDKLYYLPNIYDVLGTPVVKPFRGTDLHIGCFGAIRILKNHLTQAIAAIEFADRKGVKLFFHINSSRVEGYTSDNILKNLKSLFTIRNDHELVEHDWMGTEEFLSFIKDIDIGMQVSFTETFNMVSADLITCGVPVVGSQSIFWLSQGAQVIDETNTVAMVKALERVDRYKKTAVFSSYENLVQSCEMAKKQWFNTLGR